MKARFWHACAALGLVIALGLAAPPAIAEDGDGDPWNGMNKAIFNFNEGLDRWVIGPVGRAWGAVTPDFVETAVENLYQHLDLNIIFLNDVLQLKPEACAWDVTRFIVNSTFGLAGLIDVASMVDIPMNDEDFGQTLGYWGVPPGPYVVLPIFGPSDVRDAFGFAVDTFSQPYGYFVPIYASVPATVFRYMNLRSIYDETIKDNHEQAFDYYLFVRDAYVQNRRKKVADADGIDAEAEEDLYFYDDEDYEDEEELDETAP